MSQLAIQVTPQADDSFVVSLIGPADLAGAAMLDRHLLSLSARHPKHVVFDLSGLTFISSLCMGTLMQYRRGCLTWGGKMSLAAANDFVAGALRHARLDTLITMTATVEAALATA